MLDQWFRRPFGTLDSATGPKRYLNDPLTFHLTYGIRRDHGIMATNVLLDSPPQTRPFG